MLIPRPAARLAHTRLWIGPGEHTPGDVARWTARLIFLETLRHAVPAALRSLRATVLPHVRHGDAEEAARQREAWLVRYRLSVPWVRDTVEATLRAWDAVPNEILDGLPVPPWSHPPLPVSVPDLEPLAVEVPMLGRVVLPATDLTMSSRATARRRAIDHAGHVAARAGAPAWVRAAARDLARRAVTARLAAMRTATPPTREAAAFLVLARRVAAGEPAPARPMTWGEAAAVVPQGHESAARSARRLADFIGLPLP